jgi:predicted SAM-dependent methyltransferase
MADSQYVQYGCGLSAPSGWRNFDASPTLRFERIPLLGELYKRNKARFPKAVEFGDIVKGLPVADNSCRGVYCSHVLEHLSLEDFRKSLRNTLRILAPGGIFRLVLPDLKYCVDKYLQTAGPKAAHAFLQDTHLGHEHRSRGLRGLAVSWLGNSKHLWMWDYDAMEQELREAGFVDIRRAHIGDSADPAFNAIEEPRRWENCLGVECKKP